MKERIDEHDMTKKMMAMLRGGYKSIITEAEGGMTMGGAAQTVASAPVQSQPTQDSAPNNVPQKEVAKTESKSNVDAGTFNNEMKNFKEQVDPSSKIESFMVYPDEDNVTMIGTMFNGKAKFIFNLLDDDATIEYVKPVNVSSEKTEIEKRMEGHFKNWKDEWSKKITTEYQQK